MNVDNGTVISVMDIGGTHVAAARVNVATRSLLYGQTIREPLDGNSTAEEFLAALVRCAERLPAHRGGRWAIALPGPFDYEHGIGRYEGVGKFDALCGFDLRAALTGLLPDVRSLSFHNDAEAFVLGEWWAGAARGQRSVVGITLGTGVGSCFVRDGRVLRHGPGIPPEGRVHTLMHAGRPLEETVSRRALRRAYAQATGEAPAPDVQEIADRARRGERAAAGVFTQAFRALGRVLGPLLVTFEPTVLVVGGSIAGSWDLIAEPLRAGLAEAGLAQARRIVIQSAQFPADAPLLGVAYLATAPVGTG
ncbi:ROK family protein [Streptomyces sp. NPDC056160]|uniref:ROK family protein n=1 Tax=Streptomyces sp. NPDC056160 TaxID=3345731 RepID=UPI0035E3A23F